MTTYPHVTPMLPFTLWIKKRNSKGDLCWYPKRKVTRDFTMAHIQATIDYGEGEFYLLPSNMRPPDEALKDQEAQPKTKSALYAVWTEGKIGGANRQCIGEHLDQKAAQELKAKVEAAPLSSGLRVWIEEEK